MSQARCCEMRELRDRDYWRVRDLFRDLRYNLVVDSVIAGNTPAWIYVDDVLAPRTAWMWNQMGTMLVAGKAENEVFSRALSVLLRDRVAPDARRRKIPSLKLHYSPDTWEAEIAGLLPSAEREKTWRRFYAFDHLKVDWLEKLPPRCVIRGIDRRVLERDQLGNVNSVLGWIHSFWHSVEDFLKMGFGFCLIQDDVIASWCLTVYANGRDVELGLATMPDHRNRGYATLAAAACVERSIKSGVTPHWHCDEGNGPSMRVAEKVGFSNPTRYQVYAFTL